MLRTLSSPASAASMKLLMLLIFATGVQAFTPLTSLTPRINAAAPRAFVTLKERKRDKVKKLLFGLGKKDAGETKAKVKVAQRTTRVIADDKAAAVEAKRKAAAADAGKVVESLVDVGLAVAAASAEAAKAAKESADKRVAQKEAQEAAAAAAEAAAAVAARQAAAAAEETALEAEKLRKENAQKTQEDALKVLGSIGGLVSHHSRQQGLKPRLWFLASLTPHVRLPPLVTAVERRRCDCKRGRRPGGRGCKGCRRERQQRFDCDAGG